MTLTEFARLGGKARAAKLTPQERIAIARKAGLASAIQRASKSNANQTESDKMSQNKVEEIS